MNQLYIGIAINTLIFGYMAITNKEKSLFVRLPLIFTLGGDTVVILSTFLYWASFLVILFSPGGIIRNIAICLAMQFVINHVVWAVILGVIAGLIARKDKK